jgi:hypothetical protein
MLVRLYAQSARISSRDDHVSQCTRAWLLKKGVPFPHAIHARANEV